RIAEWSPTRVRNGVTKNIARVVLPRVLQPVPPDTPLVRVGTAEDARRLPVDMLGPDAVCYCVGVGDSVTLDLDLVARGCRVYSFDPTPESIEYMRSLDYDRKRLTFEPYGVWSENT